MKNYTSSFWFMCISMFLFMTSFNLILPELNQFITNLGGKEYKGLILAMFTISAAISRPFSGKLADFIGRKKVIHIGILFCILTSLVYPISSTVIFFLILRFVHGFSAGFMPTGATALVTDLLPENKRGVGMGIWGTFISLGIGVGQSLSFLIVKWFSMDGLFIVSSLLAVISSICMFWVDETLKEPKKFSWKFLKVKWVDVFEPQVLPAAVVMFLTTTCSGIIFVLTVEMSTFLHIENKGHFFLFYVISTILVRLFTGNLSDKIGRRQTLVIGITILIISMILTGYSTTIQAYTIASIVFGIATGISSPTLFAWTADLSHPERRGVGAGTMFIAMELGIMTGSFSTILIYDNTIETIPTAFWIGTSLAMVAVLYLIFHIIFKRSIY